MPLANAGKLFRFMHPPHIGAMVLIAAVAVGLCLAAGRWLRPAPARRVGWAIAAAVLVNELVYWVWALKAVGGEEFLRRYLPLHICGAAVFMVAVVLFARIQFLYEVVYFWALGGTVQAIITPSLTAPFPEYGFFQYFMAHGCVVVGATFATWGLGMRPRPGSVWRVYLFSLAFTAVVGAADWLLGANYMFLREPPEGESPFFFLPWPWYIAFLAPFGLAIMWLLYLPLRRTAAPAAKGKQ